jgi:hypothetical protein
MHEKTGGHSHHLTWDGLLVKPLQTGSREGMIDLDGDRCMKKQVGIHGLADSISFT